MTTFFAESEFQFALAQIMTFDHLLWTKVTLEDGVGPEIPEIFKIENFQKFPMLAAGGSLKIPDLRKFQDSQEFPRNLQPMPNLFSILKKPPS